MHDEQKGVLPPTGPPNQKRLPGPFDGHVLMWLLWGFVVYYFLPISIGQSLK
jgi:hypothetical protein